METKREMKLAQTGSLEELRDWMYHRFLSEEAQVALVMRQDETLLLEYATHFSFCKEAQIQLAKLRLKKVLLKQLERHSLCIEAQIVLVQTAL